jgi:hypothetical protein
MLRNALNRYIATRSLQDAKNVRAAERKHPMSLCFFNPSDLTIIAEAIQHAILGHDPRASA